MSIKRPEQEQAIKNGSHSVPIMLGVSTISTAAALFAMVGIAML